MLCRPKTLEPVTSVPPQPRGAQGQWVPFGFSKTTSQFSNSLTPTGCPTSQSRSYRNCPELVQAKGSGAQKTPRFRWQLQIGSPGYLLTCPAGCKFADAQDLPSGSIIHRKDPQTSGKHDSYDYSLL